MSNILLDTNFILTCIRNKIDFFEKLEQEGAKPLIAQQVIDELERITESKKKSHFRDEAKLALKLATKNKSKFKSINLSYDYVDKGILNYAKEHKDIIIATLDREIKAKTKNKNLVIRRKKTLEII